jgi:hypothetical protein
VQRQAGGVVGARALEAAGLDFERVVAAVSVGIEPFADRIAGEARLDVPAQSRPSVKMRRESWTCCISMCGFSVMTISNGS